MNENKVKMILRNRMVVAGVVSILVGAAAASGYNASPEAQEMLAQLLTLLVNLM